MRVHRGRSCRAVVLLPLLAAIALLTAAAPAQAAEPGDAPSTFVPEKWLGALFRPYYEQGPSFDFTDCQAGQSRKLWLLGFQFDPTDRTVDCTIPAGVPILLSGHGFSCSTAEAWPWFAPTAAEVRPCIERLWRAQFRSAAVFIDGEKLPMVSRFVVTSDVFTVRAVPGNAFGATPGPASVAAKGVIVYIPPLSRGAHEIRISGAWKTLGGGVVTFRVMVV
jgi:hypothetical protein